MMNPVFARREIQMTIQMVIILCMQEQLTVIKQTTTCFLLAVSEKCPLFCEQEKTIVLNVS